LHTWYLPQPGDDLVCKTQVLTRHQIRIGIVVDQNLVFIRPGNTVNAETVAAGVDIIARIDP
jgi:hypothetical protein